MSSIWPHLQSDGRAKTLLSEIPETIWPSIVITLLSQSVNWHVAVESVSENHTEGNKLDELRGLYSEQDWPRIVCEIVAEKLQQSQENSYFFQKTMVRWPSTELFVAKYWIHTFRYKKWKFCERTGLRNH